MGHYLTISKWQPNFCPSSNKEVLYAKATLKALVWLRFPKLPLKLYDKEVLYAMGDTIWKAIQVDDTAFETS